ncbi:hypothetical protein SEA_JENOS_60 [Microbacterium phage Jenos]|uniref:Uncharacterized protein n=1 Tax=Microbacterium phage McGalleon TaxID=2590936 RepID=A0A516KQZ1_9CAUD|nr:hypothetical protein H3N88_gp59 [Microbacterium phage McGalleon]QDP44110.1 hypothetical protein SEA_MCGALLEON_59 [Microbacterium phage McGalleon]QXO14529.1 hypothetical protein SEA_JENOS_60 [Microbacterium phage Jenos]
MEKKIDLIAQLLAKAESTTPEEAEALLEAAAKLMTKYAIDQAVIDERRAKEGKAGEKIVEKRIDFTGAYRGELLHMCSSVVWGLGTLRAMQYTGGKGKVFSFYLVGFESDVAQAELLINSLHLQAMVAVRNWWKAHKEDYSWLSSYEQEKKRRSFVHGFGTGAGSRIAEGRKQAVQESSTGTDLVLVSRKAKVDEHMDAKNTRKSRARTATGRDVAAGHGYEAGRKANTGEKNVTQGRGIEA